MGVPKFFRYISERYPCLSEVVSEYQLPEFDNLYLDMNGIIHVCSHPNDTDPHFRITEEKIFRDIFHYIETLFRMIQPQKLFFMAVDGVAPRAKMNQQRGRRFRSAKDAEMAEARAQLRGEKLPDAERFDSNCITPGTEFMTRLQLQLKYFVTFKISTDKLWQKTKVILSGHETPGEGEHKIMDYIRYMKSQPNYDPNTRHCLYGLDADLIMLGLCTHEPHFSLLREEVKYVKSKSQKRIPTPEETTFFLLHLSLMREYLDLEFQQVKTTLPFPYDLEHIIDDWVLMGFLVGNDFIPHLPDLHINKGALQILYRTYIDVLPTLGGYINEGGTLRLDRFQKYMEKLAAFDLEQFKEFSADLRFFESKTGRKMGESKERHSYKNSEKPLTPPKNKDLAALIAATEEILDGSEEDDDDENYVDIDSDEEEDEDGICYAEFSAHKNNYYMEKLEYDKVTPEVLRSQGEGYVRAIQWNLNYYYNGCCSWSWFYPHHYAPYISDIKNFSDLKLEYDLGKPFLPFQQLLAVLPAASKKLLPSAYHNLMEGDDSPILDFYPTDFKTDLNGKRQDWEAVVLIPFIDQACLLKAMETKENELTEEEKKRNQHGPMHIYTYTPESQGVYPAPAYFPALDNHHAKVEEVFREQLYVEPSKLVKGLCPGVKLDVYYSGFPTLKHIPFKAALEKAKVKVFETNSLGDNMILTILPQGHPDVKEVATQLLGKSIYVNWPHMFEARVVAVSNTKARFGLKPEDDSIVQQDMTKAMQDQWELACKGIEEKYLSRMGINVGKTEILVYACSLEDKKYVLVDDKMRCEKQWARYPIAYALQTTRTNIAVYEPEPDAMMTIEKLFPPGKIVFTLDQQHYGSKAEVLEIVKNKRVKVCVTIESEPNIEEVQQNSRRLGPQYQSGVSLANRIGVSGHLISRITGTILILTGDIEDTDTRHRKLNIGLNLKFNKKNEEVCGYTRRGHTGYWLYSSKAEQEIADYKERFPEVFNYLTEKTGSDDIRDTDLYPEDTANKLKELGDWLKERESNHTERQKCGAQTLSEEVVKALEEVIDNHNKDVKETKPTIISYAKPSNLYVPKPKLGQAPDSKVVHYQLFDRVVNVRECHTVPLGYKGTIIGIHNGDSSTGKEQQTMYDILFDKEFTGGLKIRCSPNRGYRLQSQALINLSHGLRGDSSRAQGKPTAVVEPSSGVEDESSSWNNNAHNSAFVNWRDRPKHDTEGLQPQRVIEGSRSARGVEGGRSAPRNVDGGRSGQREFSWVNFQNRQQPQNPPFQSAPHQLSNEYLAMFKQLQKTGSSGKGPMPARGGGVDPITDSARALKNMLKIKTPEYSGKPQPSAQPLISHSPKKPLQSNHSYCSELLSFHQKYGIKLPRYLYMDTPDSLILSTVLCGNGLEFRGEPAHSNESAAESAAYKALQHLMGGAEDHKRGAAPYHTPNHPLLIPQRPSFPMSQRMGSNWRGGPEQFPPPPPNNWFQNNFKPGWLGNSNRASHPNFFSSPQVPRYQPPPQGPMSLPFQGNGGSFQQGPQWQQPRQFIPPQAESRFRQLQTPREPPREVQQRPSEQRPPTEPPVRQPPSSAPPPASQRLRRSRIAAKFNNPLSPM